MTTFFGDRRLLRLFGQRCRLRPNYRQAAYSGSAARWLRWLGRREDHRTLLASGGAFPAAIGL